MATIVNARDIILQAASPRILPVSLPSNITSIPSTVTVTGYGTLGGIANDSANALSQVSNKLNKASSDVLSGAISVTTSGGFKAGTIAWDSAGTVTGGSGVAMTAKGIVGASSGTPTFSIDINGNAYYSGAVSAGQITTGSITAATVDTSSYVRAYGMYPTAIVVNGSSYWPSIYGQAAGSTSAHVGVIGVGSGSAAGVLGMAASGPGMYGYSSTGQGVFGISASGAGISGFGAGAGSAGVFAYSANGTALQVQGSMTITSSALVTNLNADRLDSKHASDFVQVASGRSNGDYVYLADFSAPSNQTTRAGWIHLNANAGGTGVWIPYYT